MEAAHKPASKASVLTLTMGLFLLALLLLAALKVGAVNLSWTEFWQLASGSQGRETNAAHASIVLELRLPRALMALIVGAVLALSGLVLQGLLRNPLASPSLLGISSGGALGATSMILASHVFQWAHAGLVPAAAFIGCLLSSYWMLSLAQVEGRTDTGLLILGGVAINSLVGAAIGLFTFFADDAALRSITFWSLGSVAGSNWEQVAIVGLSSLPALIFLPFLGKSLNALMLGEREAEFLGLPVERLKITALWVLSLALGAAVAYTGVIGFVGLVVPHLLRLCLGADHRQLLAASSVYGACLLLAADLLARTVAAPLELPLGVVTGAIGSPYLLYLLRRYKKQQVRLG